MKFCCLALLITFCCFMLSLLHTFCDDLICAFPLVCLIAIKSLPQTLPLSHFLVVFFGFNSPSTGKRKRSNCLRAASTASANKSSLYRSIYLSLCIFQQNDDASCLCRIMNINYLPVFVLFLGQGTLSPTLTCEHQQTAQLAFLSLTNIFLISRLLILVCCD